MSDFLMREDAPLSAEEWEKLDSLVVNVARQYLVGRQFVELVGPLGAGMEMVPVGTGESRRFLTLEMIEETFTLRWRDIEGNRRLGMAPELGPAAVAATACARREDETILGGLLNAAETEAKLGDWDEAGQALQSVVDATEALVSSEFYGPYAVVLSPGLYAKTQRVARGMGRRIGKLIRDVAEGGLFRSPVLAENHGMVLSLGPQNFDLVVGQDLITAYLGNEELDHVYRVMESLVLRVKRPGAICKLV
jgi:uncharacterized linocin/CFP29 family protein